MSYMASLTHGMPPPVSIGPGAAQTGSQHYMPRVPSLPENVYTSLQYASQRPADDNANFYNASAHSKLKAASSLGSHYFVDHMMNPHPYSSLYPGFDINAVRRKNATREITGPLKAWLSQHKKNPYPTKGEKVMLAIATRMTLTQVSTWFANARRRMKKDNLSDDEDDLGTSGDEIRQRSGSVSSRSQASSEADVSRESDISRELDHSDTEEQHVLVARPAKKCVQRLFSPDMRTGPEIAEPASSPESLPKSPEYTNTRLPSVSEMMSSIQFQTKPLPVLSTDRKSDISHKPKIWSISEIINPASRSTIQESTDALPQGPNSLPPQGFANTYSMYHNHGYPSNDSSYLYQNASHAGYICSTDYTGAPSAVQYL